MLQADLFTAHKICREKKYRALAVVDISVLIKKIILNTGIDSWFLYEYKPSLSKMWLFSINL